jgi:undecaprenyl-diphosphatase
MNLFNKTSSLKKNFREIIQKEIKVLLILFIIIFFSWLFLVIGEEVNEGSTQKFDELVLTTLRNAENNELPRGPQWVGEFMRDVTALGGGTVLAIISFVVLGFLILQKQYNEMWLILAATAGGALISFGLKEIYGRDRPNVVEHLILVNSFSFPSGHSMMSAVVYLTQGALLARIQPKRSLRIYIITIAMLFTFFIGISRIYLGVHYPTDVLGGWSVGLAWASLCWFIAWFLQKKALLKKSRNNLNN